LQEINKPQVDTVDIKQDNKKITTETIPQKSDRYQPQTTSLTKSDGELEEIVIKISRVCKVVKGGKRFSFAALVAVGDRNGNVGYGKGKANEVPFAVEKAVKDAKKHLVKVPTKNTTLPHRTWGKYGATRVIIRPACPGTGIIAGSAVRAILELIGIKDVLAKVMGSTNPTNVVKATLNALGNIKSYQERKSLLKG
jgi:small subunit ribosomal protein S5